MKFFLSKLLSEEAAFHLSTWRENPILTGYYQYIAQSYREGLSPYLDHFDDFSFFQKKILHPLLDKENLSKFINQFNQLQKIEENIDLIWNGVREDNALFANSKVLEYTNDILAACFYYFKTDYTVILEYLRIFENKVLNDSEWGMFFIYRIRIANYFKDFHLAYAETEKLFSKAEYIKDINDLDKRQVDYFLMAVDLKKDYIDVFKKITRLEVNKTEEFMFCKDFLMILKIEFAFDLKEMDYLKELLPTLENKLDLISGYHQETTDFYVMETKSLSREFFKLMVEYLKSNYIPLREFDIHLVNENFFDDLDFKKLKKVYEDSSHKIFQNLEKDLKNYIFKLIQKYSFIDIKKSVPHNLIDAIVNEILQREQDNDRIKMAIGLGIRLFRQKIFIKTFKNYVHLRSLLFSQVNNQSVALKEVHAALNQKIFPNQTDQAYDWIHTDYLELLVANVKFELAIQLFHGFDKGIQKYVLKNFESELNPSYQLFLFLYYYPHHFDFAKKNIDPLLKIDSVWTPNFLLLKYLKNELLIKEELLKIKNWLEAEEVIMAPFMFYLLQQSSKEAMAEFLKPIASEIDKKILVLETIHQIEEKSVHPATDIDVLQDLFLQNPALQAQMPKWEESSLEQQLFQNHTKQLLESSDVVWDLEKLGSHHPLSKLIERIGIKIKKQNSHTDIQLIFHCGGLKIEARLNAYNQFIVEQNGHSHHEIYEALKSLFYTLFNENYLNSLKGLDALARKEAKQKLFKTMIYPKIMKRKLFEEYQSLKKAPFEIVHEAGQNPFEFDYFEPVRSPAGQLYRPVSKTGVGTVQFRWVEPHFRAVNQSTIKEKQLELYVAYQIREMIRENQPLFVQGKIKDKDDYLIYLLDHKIEDPNIKVNESGTDFEFPQKSITQNLEGQEQVELIKRPTTFVSGYFNIYPVTE